MNWKLIIIGGLVFWVVTNILAFGLMGPLIHGSILDPTYQGLRVFLGRALAAGPARYGNHDAALARWCHSSVASLWLGFTAVSRRPFRVPVGNGE